MLRISTLALFFFLSLPPAHAQSAYQRAVNTLANDPAFAHGSLSLSVIEVQSGKLLASHDPERSVSPASNLKVLATASALALLGPDYRFRTSLEYDGVLENDGRLAGNLYLKGYGDPTLGSPLQEGATDFESLLERLRMAVQQAGIRSIDGQVVGDASAFGSDAYIRTWQWEDMGNYYAAGAWSLNIHENFHYLHFQQTAQLGAQPPIIGIDPEIPGLQFTNELTSAGRGTGDNAYIFGAPYQFDRYVRGSIPIGSDNFTIKGSIPDPPLLAAQYLRQRLLTLGITSGGASALTNQTSAGQRTVLYTHYSPPLYQIVERTNMESVNLFCELMVKTIGWEKEKSGGTETGLEVIKDYWKGKGLEWEGVHLRDGSGLSEANTVTSLFMARLLRLMARQEGQVFQPFYASLPVAGRSGSLKNRLKGTAAEGRLRAKSGTLERVRAYSGYATTRNGQLLAFSVIANNYEGSGGSMRQKLERFMLELCKN